MKNFSNYKKPPKEVLKRKLTKEQYQATQEGGTKPEKKAEVTSDGDKYTQTTTKKGTVQYRKNGKLISKVEYEQNNN